MISPSQRPLPDNTQHSQQTNIHALGGIRTHDLSRRAAVDLRLRPSGHWDRLNSVICSAKSYMLVPYVGLLQTELITLPTSLCSVVLTPATAASNPAPQLQLSDCPSLQTRAVQVVSVLSHLFRKP